MTADPDRILVGAKAIAALYGDAWDTLDAEAHKHYRAEAVACAKAFGEYDTNRRGRAIKAGHAKTRRVGLLLNGRPRFAANAETEAKVRRLIMEKQSQRAIRELTGLGNSTITRIKREIKEGLDVPVVSPAPRHAAAGAP